MYSAAKFIKFLVVALLLISIVGCERNKTPLGYVEEGQDKPDYQVEPAK
jgi:hypothetical protein